MARNEHKKVLQQLSEAYEQIHEGWEQKVGEVGSRIAGAFKRKKKEPEGKEEQPTPEDKPKVSRGAGHGIDRKAWSADVDPDDISAKRKSGESYERRKMHGLTTKEDKRQLSRDKQGEWGDEFKGAMKQWGVSDERAATMDDYGYSDEDYAEPTHSEYHPDNMERQDNPKHNYITKKGVSDKYKNSDTILDHKGKAIKRGDLYKLYGQTGPTFKPESQHQRNESTMRAKDELQQLAEAYQKVVKEEHDDSDAALWKKQMKHQPDVSPEEVERLKNRKPKPQSYSKKHPKSEKDEYHPGYGKSEGEEDDLHPATRAAEGIIGADVMWDGRRKRGIVDEVDVESGVAVVIDHDGGEHIVELGEFDVVIDPNTETPEEFKHLY